MNQYFYIFNPLCFEAQKDQQLMDKLRERIEKSGVYGDIHRTFQAGDVSNLIKYALQTAEGVKKIVIMGGDDTVNEAVQKFGTIGNEISLGIVPLGKENFIYRSKVSADVNWKKAIDILKNDSIKNIPLFVINKQLFLKSFEIERNFEVSNSQEDTTNSTILIDERYKVNCLIRNLKISGQKDGKFVVNLFSDILGQPNFNSNPHRSRFVCKNLAINLSKGYLKYLDSSMNQEISNESKFVIFPTDKVVSLVS